MILNTTLNNHQSQPNNSFSTTSTVLKDQYSEFSSDQFSSNSNFFNYETKPQKHKNNNIITSTGSYSSYRENLLIPKKRALSFLNSDDSSSKPKTTIQPKKSSRFRKSTNKDLIDTDSSTSTYDNNYITNNPKYYYNSDSSFILSTNSSSLSIQKQQYKINNTNSFIRKVKKYVSSRIVI